MSILDDTRFSTCEDVEEGDCLDGRMAVNLGSALIEQAHHPGTPGSCSRPIPLPGAAPCSASEHSAQFHFPATPVASEASQPHFPPDQPIPGM